jgi:hypothetical protein
MYKVIVELGEKTLHLEVSVFGAPPKGELASYADSNKVTLKGIVEDVKQLNSDTFKVILSPSPNEK